MTLVKWLLLVYFTWIAASIQAQERVKGKVVDADNNEPLAGAVFIATADSTVLAIADNSGNFELDAQPHQVVVYFLGYERKTITLPNKTFFIIALEADPLEIGEVVVNAYRNPVKLLDVAGDVTVISKRDLLRDNEVAITPALNRIPGVYMHSGALNTNRITIRGIGTRTLYSTNKIRAYLDEIPLTSGDGETTIEDIDLSMIDRVDVIKGPASSIFGAGLGGTINLISAEPDGKHTFLSASSMVGSFGLVRNVAKFEHSDEQGSIGVVYNNTQSNGYRDNNEYDRSSITALGTKNGKGRLSFLASFIKLKAFIPSSLDSANYINNPTSAAFTWVNTQGFEDYNKGMFGVGYDINISKNIHSKSSVFTNFKNAYELAPFGIFIEESQAIGARSSFTFNKLLAKNWLKATVGGEYFVDWYYIRKYRNNNREIGEILSDNNERRSYYNLFAQVDISLSAKTLLSAGINFNHTNFTLHDRYVADSINQSGNYKFDLIVSPRLAINHKLNKNVSVHASISHGFSTPTLAETLMPNGLINTEIKPETGVSYEAGTRGYFFNRKLFMDVALYSMHINNLLVARRTGLDEYVGVNAGKTLHNGISTTLNYTLLKTSKVRAGSFIAYSFANYKFQEFVDDEKGDFSGNKLTGTPAHIANAGIDVAFLVGLYGNVNFNYTGKMPMNDANSKYSEAYSLLNAKVGYQKKMGNLTLDINGGVNNILDKQYASMILINARSFGGKPPRYYYPGLPINYYGGFSVSYRFN